MSHTQLCIQLVCKDPLSFTLRIKIWAVAYFEPKKNKKEKSSLPPWAAQLAQTEEFKFRNAAYRPTVYKTGAK